MIVDERHTKELTLYSWALSNGYARTGHRCAIYPNQTNMLAHQLIMHLEYDHSGECICTRPYVDAGLEIDHINSNKLDNRVANLQYTSAAYNNSKQGNRKNHTSGFNGVSWHKRDEKWTARLTANGKIYNLGYHESEKEAALAYNAKAVSLGLKNDRFLNKI